jgi:hypothetical protein
VSSVKDTARFKVPASKKRNPLIAPALLRKSGVHGKSEKALRREAKTKLGGFTGKDSGE